MIKRKSYAKLKSVTSIPYLLEIQTRSYTAFLQMTTPKTKRKREGLQAVFEEVFPIESNDGNTRLEFSYYTLGKPKYDRLECQRRAVSYASPLKVKVKLMRKASVECWLAWK